MVYGTTLRLPGEFFDPSHSVRTDDPAGFITQLQNSMQKLRPVTPNFSRGSSFDYMHNIFLRHDAVRSHLQSPYDRLYQVVKRQGKSYVIKINSKDRTMSLDCLKPAYMKASEVLDKKQEQVPSDSGVTSSPDSCPPPFDPLSPT